MMRFLNFSKILLFSGVTLTLACKQRVADQPTLIAEAPIKFELIERDCDAAKEYITAANFIRERQVLGGSLKDAAALAAEVSKGCSGAAERFIEVYNLLTQAGLDGKTAATEALYVGRSATASSRAYLQTFRSAFLPTQLDLDIETSISFARRFTVEYLGDQSKAADDFVAVTSFCLSDTGLGLPKNECGALAVRVAMSGEYSKESMAPIFREAIAFLRDDAEGPQLITPEAVSIAEILVTTSPKALDNFRETFSWSVNSKGLALSRQDAVKNALTVARSTKHARKVGRGQFKL